MSQPPDKPTPATASETLLMQLATDPTYLAKRGIDMSRMGVITDPENMPESVRNWVWWDLYAELFNSRFARLMHDRGLSHTIGIGGRGRVDAIKAASVAQGGSVHTEADIIKPNWVVRNIIDKDWEAKERQRLGVPPAAPE